MHRSFWTATLAAVAVAAGAAPAHAGTVELQFNRTQALPPEPRGGSPGSISVYHLTYTAGAGEANDLTVTGTTVNIVSSPLGVRVTDAGAPLTAGQGCTAQGMEVVCTVIGQATIERFTYDTGDGNDRLRFVNTSGIVQLGAGDDSFAAELAAAPGNPNTDVDGGPGADSLSANVPGGLRAIYAGRSAPVSATLDGAANDGEAGEGDQLGTGVNGVTGGSAPDMIVGGPARDHLRGGAGDDSVRGQGGDDLLEGGDGSDNIDGGDGDEELSGEPGADNVRGGPGADSMRYFRAGDERAVTASLDDQPGDGVEGENDNIGSDVEGLTGGEGNDTLIGNDSPNVLVAEFGADTADGRGGDDTLVASEAGIGRLTGGPGRDSFDGIATFDTVESRDGVAEEITCREEGIPPIDGDPTDTGSNCIVGLQVATENTARIRLDRRGAGRVRVRCRDIDTTCVGTLRLVAESPRTRRGTGRVLARSGQLRVNDDQRPLVRLKLTRRAVRYIRARKRVTATASFATTRTLPVDRGTHKEYVTLLPPRRR